MKFCPECAKPLSEGLVDNEIRTCCPDQSCGFVFWENPTPVVAILVETPDGVVMAHNVSWPPSLYSIISGFLEKGEDPQECALRETQEELGLVGDEATLIGVYPFARMNQVIMAYHVKAQGPITLNHELDDYKIVPADEVQPWRFGTGLAVRDWLANRDAG